MQFGLFGSAQAKRGGPNDDSGAGFREFVDRNVAAEALGYHSTFLVEHHFKTGYDIRQPLGESIDLNQPNEELLAFSKSFGATMGPARGAMST